VFEPPSTCEAVGERADERAGHHRRAEADHKEDGDVGAAKAERRV
jgi:hypothetical protein